MKKTSWVFGIMAILIALFVSPWLGIVPPASSSGKASSESRSGTTLIYLPFIARNWLDRGPHLPLGYGPYRTGQAPDGIQPSSAEIEQDFGIIERETRLARTFGACDALALVPPIARQRGIHLYQGANLSTNPSENTRQMNCYNTLLSANPNIVAGIIGNETLLRGDLSETQLIDYINQAKPMGTIPVSTAETWDVWCNLKGTKPRCPGRPALSAAVDFITAHVYPYWEAVPIDHAAAHVMATYITLRAQYPNKEIIIGEAGWPTCGDTKGGAVPSIENQRRFIEKLWAWSKAYNMQVVYFETFDEPWKANQEGPVGGCWGMYSVDRTPKHSSLDWSIPAIAPAPTTPTVTLEHPQGLTTTVTKSNCAIPVFGRVYNAQPGWQVRVEVLTNQWYLQDGWYVNGLAPMVNGMWGMPEITLAGQGQYNNHSVRASLVDEFGTTQATSQVSGITRTNSCTP